MRKIRIALFMIGICYVSLSNAQSRSYYQLFNSEDKVLYLNENKWQLVFYDKTILEDRSVIKTNAPFNVLELREHKLLFCPESKEPKKLVELIKIGGVRNKTIASTHSSGMAAMSLSHKSLKRDSLYNYLVIGANSSKSWAINNANSLSNKIKKDSTKNLGFNKILFGESEILKESILKSMESIHDSIKGGVIIFYISCDGIKDKDGQYHFIVSDSKYDSLTCNYVNTLPIDSINDYFRILKSKTGKVIVCINTNHPDDFIQSVGNIDSCCVYIWDSVDFEVRSLEYILRDGFYYYFDPDNKCDVVYMVRRRYP